MAGMHLAPIILYTNRKELRYKFCQEQRKEAARKRDKFLFDKMKASSDDKQLGFFALSKGRDLEFLFYCYKRADNLMTSHKKKISQTSGTFISRDGQLHHTLIDLTTPMLRV